MLTSLVLLGVLSAIAQSNAAPTGTGKSKGNANLGVNNFALNGKSHKGSNWLGTGGQVSHSHAAASSAPPVPTSSDNPAPDPPATTSSFEEVIVTTSSEAAAPATTSDTSGTTRTSGEAGSTTGVLSSDSDIAQTLISLHNAERKDYGAGDLTWDDSLAQYASTYADGCVFVHSGGPSGENLAAGTGPGYTVTDAFNSWAYENTSYTGDVGDGSAGHWTQVVWKATTTIGCAWVPCAPGSIFDAKYGDIQYLVCEYSPGGNMDGEYADNVGSAS